MNGGGAAALLAGAAAIIVALSAGAPAIAQTAAVDSSTLSANRTGMWPDLRAPADIVIDHWGIAHIFAAEHPRRVFPAGLQRGARSPVADRLVAQARLGILSKSLGPAYVEQDRAARLFLYRGNMEKEWAAYAPDSASMGYAPLWMA